MIRRGHIYLLIFLVITSCTRVVDSIDSKESGWDKYESENYLIHVRPESQAANSIDQIQQEQEWAYNEINERLQIDFNKKILLYIYNSREDMGAADRTGKAYPELSTIEAIYNSEIKSIGRRGVSLHELTHVVAYYEWCPSPLSLYGEGLAVWMDDYWSVEGLNSHELYQISKIRLQNDNLPSIGQLVNHWNQYPASISYPAAGAFAKYLIQRHGVDAYKRVYCSASADNFDDVFYDVYDRRIGIIEDEFHRFLRNYR